MNCPHLNCCENNGMKRREGIIYSVVLESGLKINEWMIYKAYTMLLHTPNHMGGMQVITCITDESKMNSKVTFCEFRQRGDHLYVLADNCVLFCA